jgi:hypothetical protein
MVALLMQKNQSFVRKIKKDELSFYVLNIKFVLAALATGNGGAEIWTFLGFLDLP